MFDLLGVLQRVLDHSLGTTLLKSLYFDHRFDPISGSLSSEGTAPPAGACVSDTGTF